VSVPETFKTVDVLAGRESKEGKERRRSSGCGVAATCRLCPNAKPGGVLVKCQEKGCKLSAHPLCGFEHGWYLFLDTLPRQEQGEAPPPPAAGSLADDERRGGRRDRKNGKGKGEKGAKAEPERLVFCQEHAPHEEDDDDTLYCLCQRR
jgi:hypothetical protein